MARFKIVPAVYLILCKEDKILLLRRFNTGISDGKYSFVSGHLNGNETFRQAMVREAKEEAGIIIKPDDLKLVHFMNRFESDYEIEIRERIDIFFKVKKYQGEPVNMEPDKCDDLSWFAIDNLPENTIPRLKKVLEYIKNKIIYSEFGFSK